MTYLEDWDVTVVTIGPITVGTRWAIGDPDPDQLINNAELIGGIPCARLVDVVAYKKIADRPKDRHHVSIIEARRRAAAPDGSDCPDHGPPHDSTIRLSVEG